MPPIGPSHKQSEAEKIAARIGTIGGLLFFGVDLFFIFAFPDAQGAIGLIISPFCAILFGCLTAVIVWGALSTYEGKATAIIPAIIAFVFLALLTRWIGSEIWQMTHPTIIKPAQHGDDVPDKSAIRTDSRNTSCEHDFIKPIEYSSVE